MGGCTSLCFVRPGHFVATCGMDKRVVSWDLNLLDQANTFQVGEEEGVREIKIGVVAPG